jgi:uncharacterized damage-inducible protein DinB
MKTRSVLLAAAVVLAVTAPRADAQTSGSANPYTDAIKAQAESIRKVVLRTAEKVPDDVFAFKPTPEVRSLAGILGHIADGNLLLCGIASGDKPAILREHEKKTTRADLVAALKESFAFCDKVAATITDANGSEVVDFFGQKQPKLGILAFNNSHMMEHYGNLVTYMRLKNIVPPSSERSQ